MSKLTLIASFTAKNEHIEPLKQEILKLIPPTRAEDGCLEYFLLINNDAENNFVIFEVWESHANWQKHTETEHFLQFKNAVKDFILDKNVTHLSSIDA